METQNQKPKRKSRRDAEAPPTSSTARPKKVKIMGESGQTDAERRALRCSQRQLQKRITSSEVGDGIEDPNSEAFDNVRKDNNALFDEVRFTREAVLDGENLDLISKRVKRQIDHLVQVSHYDAAKFAHKLKNQCTTEAPGGSFFDWKKLGREAGACFNAVPSRVSFLHGPMDVEFTPKEKKKKKRQKKKEEEGEEERPEEETEKDRQADSDKLSAVEKSMKVLVKTLKSRCREEVTKKLAEPEESDADSESKKSQEEEIKKKGVCAVQYMFNPKSFTQTVENIFHFSFLVKRGGAGISVVKDKERGTKRPMVRMTRAKEEHPPPKQAIVAFTMKDWRLLCDDFNVEKSDIPHRTGSKHTRKEKVREDDDEE